MGKKPTPDSNSIIALLDIRAEYAALGVRVNGSEPNGDGWLSVHAIGRDDSNPSAAINLTTGRYKDHGGDGEGLSLWDFAAKHGSLGTWQDARDHYAAKVGVSVKHDSKKKGTAKRSGFAFGWQSWESVVSNLKQKTPDLRNATYFGAWDYETFRVVRFNQPTANGQKQEKEFRPIHLREVNNNCTQWFSGYPKRGRNLPLYRKDAIDAALPDAMPIVVGGEKCVQASECLGLLATTNAGGEMAVDKTDWSPLRRFSAVVIVTDNDKTGEEFGVKVSAILGNQNPEQSVKVVKLPGLPPKGDIVEWAEAGGTREAFLKIVEETNDATCRPEIEISLEESRVADEAIAALAKQENVYQRGGSLVQVVQGADALKGIARPKDAPRIAPIRQARLRELLSTAAVWFQPSGDDSRAQIRPPDWVVRAVDARGQWQGIRRLETVLESPVLRSDGTILQTPGYDESTGLLLIPSSEFPPAPEMPTRADALKAVDALLEVVEDFPFSQQEHRSACLAAMITPAARYAFHGCAPLNLFDANSPGCGKSLLTDVISQIVAGREMAKMSQPHDDDEFRKRITSLAIAAERLILIDNIDHALGGASLDAALTATSWSDRILGQTAMATGVPMFATWYATGNNVVLAADTARRTLHIRLDSTEENPEERSGFHHADLLHWVRDERPRLAVAVVTILSAYFAAGRPTANLKNWGSFEAWSAIVRQALVWVGLPDPAATRKELTSQSDRQSAVLRQLIAGWEEVDEQGTGLTVAGVIKMLGAWPDQYETLRNALWELAPPKEVKHLNSRSIGMKLHHLRGRVVGGKQLVRKDDKRAGAVWTVCGTTGTSGTISGFQRAQEFDVNLENIHRGAVGGTNGVSPASPVSPDSPTGCFHDWQESRGLAGPVISCRLCGTVKKPMAEAVT